MHVFGALRSAMATKSSEIAIRQDSPEMEWFVAHAALKQSAAENNRHHLEHGVNHLAGLLAVDPTLPVAIELLDDYRRAAGGWLSSLLPPQGEKGYYAVEALRACAFADEGRLEEALGLLCQVQQAKRDAPYLETWGADWMERGLDAFEPTMLLYFFGLALMTFPEAKVLPVVRERRLRRIAGLAAKAETRLESPQWDMTLIGLHRKAGLFDEAIRRAKIAIERRPSWETFTALGLALREAGAMGEAEAAFRTALAHQPDDITALLEIADGWFEAHEWNRARRVYEEVLARQPGHVWALPSALFCGWREQSSSPFPDDGFPPDLRRLAQEGNDRAGGLFSLFTPWVGYVPAPTDALAQVTHQLVAQDLAGGGKISLTDVEGPSNLVAMALQTRTKGGSPPEIIYGNIATPDPRRPIEPIAYDVFRLEGTHLVPALAPPAEDVRREIETLATQPFVGPKAWAAASRLGARLSPASVRDVLACLVHPSSPPNGGRNVVEWVARVQLTAAQVVAHVDDGWDESVRRAALFSMLLGPRDWVTTAAIVALALLAQDHPAIACDVHAAFGRLDAARPSSGGMTYEHALLWHWQSVPILFPNEREDLAQRLTKLFAD